MPVPMLRPNRMMSLGANPCSSRRYRYRCLTQQRRSQAVAAGSPNKHRSGFATVRSATSRSGKVFRERRRIPGAAPTDQTRCFVGVRVVLGIQCRPPDMHTAFSTPATHCLLPHSRGTQRSLGATAAASRCARHRPRWREPR